LLDGGPVGASVVRVIVGVIGIATLGATASAQTPEPPDAVHAQPELSATIDATGRVIDALGKPVRNATISVEGGPDVVTSDRNGRYTLRGVALGASLVIDATGYQTSIAAVTGPTLDDIVLLDEGQASEVIDVHGAAPAEAPGAAQLDRDEVSRVPGTGGDLVRTLTIMPGVVNAQLPLGFGGIVIRGAAPEDSKILIDGFEVPLLYHAIGFRAVVPTEAIESLDYLPGGFDVAYGRAASGIVALTTRGGGDARSEQAEVSVIDGGVLAQGAIGRDTHYMIGFRRSTIDLVLPSILPSSLDLSLTTVPRYYDEQLRIDHRLSPRWDVSLSSLGSDDLLELFADKAENPDKRFYTRTRYLRLTGTARWHDGPWSAVLATSGLLEQIDFEVGAHQFAHIGPSSETSRAELTRNAGEVAGLRDVVWRVGGEAAIGRASIDLALPPQRREGQPRQIYNPDDTSRRYDGVVWTPDFAQWAAVAAGLGPAVRLTTGVRIDEFARGGDVAVEPRGELKVKISEPVSLRLSAGAYRRPPENREELTHAELHPERSTQVIGGVEVQPREALRVQGSLYYTDRKRLLTRDPDGVLGNFGRGTTYGGELLATYRQDPWFVWVSASLSHSTRIDYPGAMERLFDYDQPVSVNAAASWKHGSWQLGARFQLYSGLPTTPVMGSVFDSDTNLYDPIFGRVNSERAPLHHQVDLRVDRSWQWGSVLMTAFLDVQNVYLNQSVAGYAYSYDYSQRIEFKSLPIIPSIGLRGVL
jgi:outer membrane receptor protein involved in Fe transport